MTQRDYAIVKLFEDAIKKRDPEAMTTLWRRFADWHGEHPDFAVVLQEEQGFDDAGLDAFERIRAKLLEKQSSSVH